MATGYRETQIRIMGVTQVVRTSQTSTVAKLEREHTANVQKAARALRNHVITERETQEIADIQEYDRPGTPGFPGSGDRMRTSLIKHTQEMAAQKRAETRKRFVAVRSEFDSFRKPFPKVKYDIAVDDPRVADTHECITDLAA